MPREEIFAPISDGKNQWVFIGRGKPDEDADSSRQCATYADLHNGQEPDWGRASQASNFKGNVLCCDMKLKFHNFTTEPSWNDARSYCENDDLRRLCTRDEYCPNGRHHAPDGGLLRQSVWAASFDLRGSWLAIGHKFPKTLMCNTFGEIAKGQFPPWGFSHAEKPKRSVLKCCQDQFWRYRQSYMTYANAVEFCNSKSMRLCKKEEYCPGGKGQPPRGGARPNEGWSPVSDESNQWIWTGSSQPGRLCQTHSELNGVKPDWGTGKGVSEPYVQCCPTTTRPSSWTTRPSTTHTFKASGRIHHEVYTAKHEGPLSAKKKPLLTKIHSMVNQVKTATHRIVKRVKKAIKKLDKKLHKKRHRKLKKHRIHRLHRHRRRLKRKLRAIKRHAKKMARRLKRRLVRLEHPDWEWDWPRLHRNYLRKLHKITDDAVRRATLILDDALRIQAEHPIEEIVRVLEQPTRVSATRKRVNKAKKRAARMQRLHKDLPVVPVIKAAKREVSVPVAPAPRRKSKTRQYFYIKVKKA